MMESKAAKPGSRRMLVLAIAWLVIVIGYSIWGVGTGRGLAGRIAAWQVERTGSYSGMLVFILPFAVLGFPSIWYIMGRILRAEAAAKGCPEAERRYARRWAIALLGLAGLAAAAGITGLTVGLGKPDGSEPAAPLSLARLRAGQVPEGRVRIEGRMDPRIRAGATERRRQGAETSLYVGFRPEGSGPDDPLILFIDTGLPDDPAGIAAFPAGAEGVLRRDALPDYALRAFARQGVRIAGPHYVLDQSRDAERGSWLTLGLTGLFMTFIFGLVGLLVLLRPAVRAGRARQ